MDKQRLLMAVEGTSVRAALTTALAPVRGSFEVDEVVADGAAPLLSRLRGGAYDCLIVDEAPAVDRRVALVRAARAERLPHAILAVTERDDDGARLVVAGASDFVPCDELSPAVLARRVRHVMNLERCRRHEQQLHANADEILAFVSHDMKNPLSAIRVATEQLLDGGLDEASRLRCLACIRGSLGRADRLVRDLLDASLLETGKLTVRPGVVDAGALLERVAADHELLAREAGLRLEVRPWPGPLEVFADPDRIRQAIGNLVQNAVSYAAAGGVLELDIEPEPRRDTVCFRVADRGPGLTDELLDHIFDRTWQVKHKRRADAGIGLTIVKAIAEAHGGGLRAQNRAGGGAEFVLSLLAAPSVARSVSRSA